MQTDEIVVPVRAKADDSDLDKLEKKAKQSTNALTQTFKNWADGIKKLFQNAFDFSGYFNKLKSKLSNLIDFDFLLAGIQKLKETIGIVTSQISKGFQSVTGAFQKVLKDIRSKLKDAGQLIGKQLAVDMKTSLNEVVTWFNKNEKQISKALTQVARDVGHLLASFGNGLIQIVRMGKTFVDWFNNLPNAIKGATYAVTALWAVLKAGPIGVLASIVTAVGALKTDYEFYKKNKQHQGEEGYKKLPVALPGIWQILQNDDGSSGSKNWQEIAGKIITKLLTAITDWLNNNTDSIISTGQQIVDAIGKAIDYAGDVLSGATNGQNDQTYKDFGEAVGTTFSKLIDFAISAAGDLGGHIVSAIASALSGHSDTYWEDTLSTSLSDNSFAQGIGAFIQTQIMGLSPTIGIVTAIATFLHNSFKQENYKDQLLTPDLSAEFYDLAKVVCQTLVGAIETFHVASQTVIGAIKGFLTNSLTGWTTTSGDSTFTFTDENTAGLSNLLDGFITGAIGYIASGGNIGVTIATGIGGLFSESFTHAWENAKVRDVKTGKETGEINWEYFFKMLGIDVDKTIQNIETAIQGVLDLAIKGLTIASDVEKDLIIAIYNIIASALGIEKLNANKMSTAQKSAIQTAFNAILVAALTGNVAGGVFGGLVTAIFDSFTQALNGRKIEQLSDEDWKQLFGLTADNLLDIGLVFLDTFTKAFQAVQDWWNKPETQKQVQALKAKWKTIWEGDKDHQGLQTVFDGAWETVKNGFVDMINGLWALIQDPMGDLATNIAMTIYNAIDSLMPGVLSFLGFKAPQKITTDEEAGTVTLQTGGGGAVTMQDRVLSDGVTKTSDFLKAHKQHFGTQKDSDGNSTVYFDPGTTSASSALWSQNGGVTVRQHLNGLLNDAWNSGNIQLLNKLIEYGQGIDEDPLKFRDKLEKGKEQDYIDQMDAIVAALIDPNRIPEKDQDDHETGEGTPTTEANADVPLTPQDSGDKKQGEQNTEALQTTASEVSDLSSKADTQINVERQILAGETDLYDLVASHDGGGQSYGGRITSPGRHLIGEDGTEYVIPINKTNRAVELIQDMVAEMGGKAKDAVANALGITSNSATIGGSLLQGNSVSGATGGMNIVYNNNVSAPVTINVTSSGSNAAAIGQQVYSSAQRALLRTLRAAVG